MSKYIKETEEDRTIRYVEKEEGKAAATNFLDFKNSRQLKLHQLKKPLIRHGRLPHWRKVLLSIAIRFLVPKGATVDEELQTCLFDDHISCVNCYDLSCRSRREKMQSGKFISKKQALFEGYDRFREAMDARYPEDKYRSYLSMRENGYSEILFNMPYEEIFSDQNMTAIYNLITETFGEKLDFGIIVHGYSEEKLSQENVYGKEEFDKYFKNGDAQ